MSFLSEEQHNQQKKVILEASSVPYVLVIR